MIRFVLLITLLASLHLEPSEQISRKELGSRFKNTGAAKKLANSNWMAEARKVKTNERILLFMKKCEAIEAGRGIVDIVVETVRYKDLTTGDKVRKAKGDECREKMRPLVNDALAKGYIIALQDPPCRHGEGSFKLYDKRRRSLINIHRRLPC